VQVQVSIVGETGEELSIVVRDDGVGFDTDTTGEGFGLAGMQERVTLAGGTLDVTSGEHGTVVSARLPARVALDLAQPERTL
jgi:signal transduction histidine kinase